MKNKINALQFGSMLIMIIMSSFIGIGIFAIIKSSGKDAYISVLLAGIIGFLILLMIFYISNYDEDKSIGELNLCIFGPILGKIINVFLIIIALFIGASAMYNLINFIVSQFLSETPLLVIGIFFSLLCLYINIKGIETISRVSLIFIVMNTILYFTAVFGLLPEVELSNLKPFLEFGWTSPLKGIFYLITLNISPIFLLLSIPKKNIVDKNKIKKTLSIFYIISVIFMFATIFITLSVLGIELSTLYQYPEYIVLKRINLFNFLDRLENILNIQWILGLFIVNSIVIYYTSEIIKKNNKIIKAIISLVILLLSTYLFSNNTSFNNWSYNFLPYIRLVFILIHVIILIVLLFKKRKVLVN